MAWTQADIDKLKVGIASGARRIEYGSGETRRVLENRPLSELWQILAEMEAEIRGSNQPTNRRVAGYNSGL
ncbi:hypothetical protein FG93_05497 [Bosea sp. LC85]|uniref:phage head-tail joining protein n=1 Tax=Bosea sp. LC85 TaxID=1502851 RepID=UPI0004E44104|nr:hypothetical protein [Bosea sp. LC85]KFC63987.1 hypothetical protein FG93_05497 [Bosea sp. LC85]